VTDVRGDNRAARQVTTPNNLPAELTSFVGREPQLAELRRLLHRSRLITLTGPGGAGKTRLALRLANETIDKHPDGVWLLDLAPVGDARLLERTLAAVCGIKEDPNRPVLDVLVEGLNGSRSLILFDGCEHLVDECAELTSRLLRSSRRLSIVATSREPLGVTGEVIWRTPSLTVPRLDDAGSPELLMESEAIRLFVDRARLSRSDFELDATNARAVAQICTRLEGIPLAIELAAGLAGVMTLEEILDRLRHRFRLLTGGSRSSLPRHQTLRQAVDWSYGLLSSTEQALFARLSVFAGGFDVGAAEAVVQGPPIDADEVLPVLSRLVHKSLVVAEPSRPGATRYRMLDTIREYAAEKLQLAGEAEWRRRHADYFLERAIEASQHLRSPDQVKSLRRIDEEQSNIRLALEWSLAEMPANALRLTAAMGEVWWMERQYAEGLEWLTRALELETTNTQARAAALVARSRMSRRRGDWETSKRDSEECIALIRGTPFRHELCQALSMLGIVSAHIGNLGGAAAAFGESRQVAEEIGDYERVASSLNNVAMIESSLGELDVALHHVNEALATARKLGDLFLTANILDTAGRIKLRLGNLEASRRDYEEGLAISFEFRDTVNIADLIEGMGLLAGATGDAGRCLVLIAAGDCLRTVAGVEATPEWIEEVRDAVSKAKSKLTRTAVDAAGRQGAAMDMEAAVAFALGRAEERRDGGTRLTDREIQVARLIASGLTNGEVAGRLRISERTVDAHVEHIRNKLGLRTRTQIAVWARERVGTS
jgi:non-specific serine/threonine protein kinase